MKAEGFSLTGTVHSSIVSENEDRFDIAGQMVVVADGMGGLEKGGVAADLVVRIVCDMADKSYDLLDMLNIADKSIENFARQMHVKMGVAVAVAHIDGDMVDLAWQGNVRVYLVRKGELLLLTQDHVLDDGFGRKRLTRCLKGHGLIDVPIIRIPVVFGDRLLIATDGCYEHVSESILQTGDILRIKEACNGVEDDASCVVVKLELN